MPQNQYLQRIFTTELTTPAVAEWLIEVATGWEHAPEGSLERFWADNTKTRMRDALQFYREHRGTGDDERIEGHKILCHQTRDALTHLRAMLHTLEPMPAPMTHAVVVGIIARMGAGGLSTFSCQHCGGNYRATKSGTEDLCSTCAKRYIKPCAKCAGAAYKGTQQVTNNDNGQLEWYCSKCTVKVAPCVHCGNGVVGKAVPGHKNCISAAELTKQAGGKVCFRCADAYRKLSCGHVAHKGEKRYVYPNKEDDATVGERRQGGAEAETVCAKCITIDIEHYNCTKNLANNTEGHDEVGSSRTYGVELEVTQVQKMSMMAPELKAYWTAKRDGSLPEGAGVELASGILRGNRGLQIIKQVCDYAADNKWAVDWRGGYHLHIGVDDLDRKQLAAVALGYMSTRGLWEAFVAKSRVGGTYSRPCPFGPDAVFAELTGEEIMKRLTANEDRYRWINWQALNKFGTVEVRIHQATLVYEKVANWIKAHTRFVDWCAKPGGNTTPMRKVFTELRGRRKHGGKLLEFIGQEVWQDKPLADWFAERIKVLQHGAPVLVGDKPTCDGQYPEADMY